MPEIKKEIAVVKGNSNTRVCQWSICQETGSTLAILTDRI